MDDKKQKEREYMKAYMKKYYHANKNKWKEYYSREDVKEKRAKYFREYRKKNPELIKEIDKRRYEKKKERLLREQEAVTTLDNESSES